MKLFLCMISLIIPADLLAMDVLFLHNNWTFRNYTKQDVWKPAVVPGVVHLDLLRNKHIPDPFYGDNEQQVSWIAEQEWEYKTLFFVSKQQLQKENLNLVFEGLDTYCTVYLNKNKILSCYNMFRTWRVVVKQLLQEGQNELRLVFHSAIHEGKKKAALVPLSIAGDDKYNKVFTRKAQYHYGWDWGPTFITCGIWRPVKLEMWNSATIRGLQVNHQTINKKSAELQLGVRVEGRSASVYTLEVRDVKTKKVLGKSPLLANDTNDVVTVDCRINNPKLWWCNGLGEPYLYTLGITLKNERGISISTITKNIGLRTIKLMQEKDSIGSSFSFVLNGKPVFIKGANYIPQDSFLPRLTQIHYNNLLKDVVASKMNMLRVWGGGVYEDDIFYELCDKYGIMVWQDFMFACAMNPGDTEFLDNVRHEVRDNVQRLQHHASIALWCGNNENNEGWFNWGWQKSLNYSEKDSALVWNWYKALFHKLIPEELQTNDPTRQYVASSPLYGWGKKESMTHGDSHYWGVWWGLEPVETYNQKVGRFMSEYGMQAVPMPETLQRVIPDGQMNVQSKALKNHQKHPTGFENLQTYLLRVFKPAVDFFAYTYQTQLLQKHTISLAIEAHRRAKTRCMGTLYWQFNDCWPVVSWAGRDSEGRWKALQYNLPKVFDNIIVSAVQDGTNVTPVLINDGLELFSGELHYSLLTFDGAILTSGLVACTADTERAKPLQTINLAPFLVNRNKHEVVLALEVRNGTTSISKKTLYFGAAKDLWLKDPEIQMVIRHQNGKTLCLLTAKRLAKDVFVRGGTNNPAQRWSDNFFDLLPGETKTIVFPGIIPKNTIQSYSLFHSYQ